MLLDTSGHIAAHAKSPTTHHDLSIGLRGAVTGLGAALNDYQISLVSLSTTLATNALVEGHGRRVCLILVGYSRQQLERARLSEVMGSDPVVFIAGGHTAGGEPVAEPDFDALANSLQKHEAGIDAYAVSAMFGVRNPAHEIAVRAWLHKRTAKPVTCGYELSSGLDAPRRALTAVLNARLIPLIHQLLDSTRSMLKDFDINAPMMVVKGDGSLVSDSVAALSPVETILSGPAASVVGANFLSEKSELVVSDMGGTTTDVAVLENGLPALDPDGATVGGWTTMVRAIKIHTYGLGGDSEIAFDRQEREFAVGPLRVLPVSRFLHAQPQLTTALHKQLELPYGNTHNARFVFLPATINSDTSVEPVLPDGISAQQRELWLRVSRQPFALQTLFEDQTLEVALKRLIAAGHLGVAAFTPTDALLLLGDDLRESLAADSEAASLAAQLLMRYSEQNLGPVWDSVEAFAASMHEQVARDAALAIIETVLVSEQRRSTANNKARVAARIPSASTLPKQQRDFIRKVFEGGSSDLALQANLKQPLIGLGAPAVGYYRRVAELLGTRVELPALAGVANAIGAVAGSISQSRSLTITPVGGKRVKLHADSGPIEFDDLEAAVSEAEAILNPQVIKLAEAAGAEAITTDVDRQDIIASNQGETVFFESTITVTASGRPATA